MPSCSISISSSVFCGLRLVDLVKNESSLILMLVIVSDMVINVNVNDSVSSVGRYGCWVVRLAVSQV